MLQFTQFRKFVRRAFEAQSLRHRIQAKHNENLLAHLETKIVFPLQFFRRVRKIETIFADGVSIHKVARVGTGVPACPAERSSAASVSESFRSESRELKEILPVHVVQVSNPIGD